MAIKQFKEERYGVEIDEQSRLLWAIHSQDGVIWVRQGSELSYPIPAPDWARYLVATCLSSPLHSALYKLRAENEADSLLSG